MALTSRKFEVTEGPRPYVDLEAEASEVTKGYYRKAHLPAMQVSKKVERCGGELLPLEIVTRPESSLPFGRKANVT